MTDENRVTPPPTNPLLDQFAAIERMNAGGGGPRGTVMPPPPTPVKPDPPQLTSEDARTFFESWGAWPAGYPITDEDIVWAGGMSAERQMPTPTPVQMPVMPQDTGPITHFISIDLERKVVVANNGKEFSFKDLEKVNENLNQLCFNICHISMERELMEMKERLGVTLPGEEKKKKRGRPPKKETEAKADASEQTPKD